MFQAVVGALVAETGSTLQKGLISRSLDYSTNAIYPNMLPGPEDIMHCVRTGLLDVKDAKVFLACHGISFSDSPQFAIPPSSGALQKLQETWARVYISRELVPQPGEILDLLNRKKIDETQADEYFHRLGFNNKDTRQLLMGLRNEVPGSGDLVRFAVRHVFEQNLIDKFGYNDNLQQAFVYWHEQQGFGYDARTPKEVSDGRPPYSFAQAQWWSHWILPSPSQGYEMVQRLRPTGGKNGGPRDVSGEVFDRETLDLLLYANDYPSFYRPKLSAVSYRPMGLRQIQQLYKQGLADRTELIELYQDVGYRKESATVIADLDIAKVAKTGKSTIYSKTLSAIISAYTIGTVSRDDAAVALFKAAITDPDQLQVFLGLPPNQQANGALSDLNTVIHLIAIDTKINAALAQQVIASIKRLYIKGKISRNEASNRLTTAGINETRRDQYLLRWDQLLDVSQREVSAAKIQEYYRVGILGGVAAKLRLSNLGFSDDDSNLLLAETQRNMQIDAAKALLSAAKSQQQKTKALEGVVKAARAEHNRVRSELARHGSPGQLKTWYVRGLVDDATFLQRLQVLDWTPEDSQTALGDAQLAKQDALAKKGFHVAGKP